MSLKDELGFLKPVKHKGHETLLNIIVTANLLIKEAQKLFRPYGLTNAQFDVLMILETQSENGTLNQTELGHMLLVNRSNVTGLVDRMEQAGWVRRIPDGEDRRINLVEITDNGMKILDSTKNVYMKRIEEITSVLSDNEKNLLVEILEKIRKKI
ncbi:MAG: MarR family transcriptional regulator [Candidatus Latescibacter sp.]|nr:MarR family transcriptional regulator [Candidatus Latescibacter sp.]